MIIAARDQSPQSVHNESILQHFANQRRSQGLHAWPDDGNYLHRQYGWSKQHKLRNDGGRGDNKRDNKKSLPECKDKGIKPWCLHGKHTNHSYDKYHANPCNQAHELQQ